MRASAGKRGGGGGGASVVVVEYMDVALVTLSTNVSRHRDASDVDVGRKRLRVSLSLHKFLPLRSIEIAYVEYRWKAAHL